MILRLRVRLWVVLVVRMFISWLILFWWFVVLLVLVFNIMLGMGVWVVVLV